MKHEVEEIRLKNGARGLLIDVPDATTMSMQFHFRAGSRYAKSKDIEQVAHIMEHMAFGTNIKYSSEQFDYELTKNGAYRNAYTSDFSMGYETFCADFEWDRILELQKLAICQPKFNEVELEAEKGNVRSELTNNLNDQARILWPRIQQLLGEDILTVRQSLATVGNVTLADVREHHKRTHTTSNMRFVISGKLQGRKSEIRRQIEDFQLPVGDERFAIIRDEIIKSRPTIIRRKDATNLTFGLCLAIPCELNDEELDAMDNLNHILTGTMFSRIFGAARKKGLAYYLNAYTEAGQYNSVWEISGQVNHEAANELFDIITRELKNVLMGKIKKEEVDAAKSYALGRYQMGAQTVSQISNFYTGRYFFDGFIKNYEAVPKMINKVTSQRMVEMSRKFFAEDKWVLAAVSSGERQEIVDLSDKVATLFETS